MNTKNLLVLCVVFCMMQGAKAQIASQVGLYRTFERSLENKHMYANKFTDVELNCSFTSPSGEVTDFIGFFDGNGSGGGDKQTGDVWKIRFIPNEIGEWQYTWFWSDATEGGQGFFNCDSTGAGKGILRPYEKNPRWLAYNGENPVWLKSYYETGHGSIAQPFDWIAENVYQPMMERGYNHLQVNWLLSLCCFEQFYHDGPQASTSDLALYQEGEASSTMRLAVWHLMEHHVSWLNDRDIGLHMFLGFDGSQNEGPKWSGLSETEKDFFVRYVVARLAPYANLAGWSFVWEVPGDREDHELGWARLVKKYDVFDHLRTYEDEYPLSNEYHRPEYNFAAIENHLIFSQDRDLDRPYWKEAWTHHEACLAAYVPGKPVYMIEGNALWRRFWQERTEATPDDLRRAAWACVTAGASFNWCGHAGEESLVAFGPEGLPFHGGDHPYAASATHLDILARVMNEELDFYRMNPADSLLSGHETKATWCLSEPGSQYLVFSTQGSPFTLQLTEGFYKHNQWMDAKTGETADIPELKVQDSEYISFTPPDRETDWILMFSSGHR